MIPNLDPKAIKSMMNRMGMKSEGIDAIKVIIECADKNIVISNPEVMKIEMQGNTSFQISGSVSETGKSVEIEISDDDISLIAEKTGISDKSRITEELKKNNGDVALTIINLTQG
ncbi:MAG: nascent polypeptide-associated complex protein [Candidatus Marsarchaeota archaeon]|nr:nascent polypeptide-associated complex protein [Candidatus Marsarchaeota archaeon]MCL5106004.1 nascent polypeptide-associated complex protein [Candidatus Marsarchaeota archaeon]